ncbi:MAG TPA: HAMP domain-containing sensor histidine kinase [Actinomycetota bacterium]|nr:HAMP domain-containing sensor histidine kinase [Actinomycetota bacterium]
MRAIESPSHDRLQRALASGWVDVAWLAFAAANLVAMVLVPRWETVPFHFIWVSLTIVYGYRVWAASKTALVLTAVVLSTGALLVYDVLREGQLADELTEVPLMGAMFLAMVWHAQRRRSAMADLRQISDANLRLLHRERQFVQDASHELRTPITVALGHAELVVRASDDAELAEDARIVVDELLRLRRLADRLLLLATSEDPDFLSRAPIQVEQLLHVILQRWAPINRRWRLGARQPATVVGDADRLELAVDALVENAVKHTGPGDEIRLGTRRQGDLVAVVVADSGTGIPADRLDGIFERFARLDQARSREMGGVGLGLAIVQAIAQAHGGTVAVRSTPGGGSVFQLLLPLMPTTDPTSAHRGVTGQILQVDWLHG